MRRPTALVAAILLVGSLAAPRANAFGTVFTREGQTTQSAKHRVAIAFGASSTTVWDEVVVSPRSGDLAYVIPVLSGTRISAGSDAWLRGLETSTDPAVFPPPSFDSVGCSCDREDQDRGSRVNSPLLVIAPHETATFAGTDAAGLAAWLTARQLTVPTYALTAMTRVGAAGYDFAVFHYAPGCSVQALQPIVLTIPRVKTSFTLEMLDLGATSAIDLSLFTLGSSRYRVENFPEASVDVARLDWGRTHDESNFDSLLEEARGRGVVTEFAATMPESSPSSQRRTANPTLSEAYKFACVNTASGASSGACGRYTPSTPGVVDASADPDASDASSDASNRDGSSDASLDGSITDASTGNASDADASAGNDSGSVAFDAGIATSPGYTPDVCATPDDYAVARNDLDPRSLVVTRMETRLSLPLGRTSLDFVAAPGPDYVISVQTYDSNEEPDRMAVCSGNGRTSRSGVGIVLALVTAGFVRFRSGRRRGPKGPT